LSSKLDCRAVMGLLGLGLCTDSVLHGALQHGQAV